MTAEQMASETWRRLRMEGIRIYGPGRDKSALARADAALMALASEEAQCDLVAERAGCDS